MTIIEQWRPVAGLEGRYEVSNLGRVRNVERKVSYIGRGGKPCTRTARSRVRATYASEKGYPSLKLAERGTVPVHTLVLEAFVGPRPPGKVARHLDDNKSNNALSNLVYGTPKENGEDAVRNGRTVKGERQGRSKLTPADVILIRRNAEGFSQSELGRRHGVTPENIRRIQLGLTWKHVAMEPAGAL